MLEIILGGTFDPPHEGHVAFARQAQKALKGDRVVFLPAGQNPLKPPTAVASPSQRLRMVELAIESAAAEHWEVAPDEVLRSGPSFLVDTLESWARQGKLNDWIFCMGAEVVRTLPQWKQPQRLLELVRIAAIARPGEHLPDLSAVAAELGVLPNRFIPLEFATAPVSSTQVRGQLASLTKAQWEQPHCPVPGLPESVWQFIQAEGLYRPSH